MTAQDHRAVPEYARLCRGVGLGKHRYLEVFPRVRESPALLRVARDPEVRAKLVEAARVRVLPVPGFAWINTRIPCIELSWLYLKTGTHRDLYLDMLHELTHLRQLSEGADLWDARFAYVDRPTEIEGYAVAVEEGRRLGMTEAELRRHLHNPWMSAGDVERLTAHVAAFLARPAPPA
ncbi:MAG: hypothetical protein HY904_07955 [Deltaproteobacteria bacterium]|nr:hypothetical protein [Deltaproteobacteria bacterium]